MWRVQSSLSYVSYVSYIEFQQLRIVGHTVQGMRFCELIKDDLAALAELPESTPELEAALTAPMMIMMYRSLLSFAFSLSRK